MSSAFMPTREIESKTDRPAQSYSYRAQWEQVFQSLATICCYPAFTQPAGRKTFPKAVAEECGRYRPLQQIGHLLMHQGERVHELGREEIILKVYALAQPYYRALWASCSNEEKLALYRLASDRFLHSENPEIRCLLCKGLIVLDPDLRLMNESFRRFVLTIARGEQIAALEAQAPKSFWHKLSWPLGIVLTVWVLFLIVTQEGVRAGVGVLLGLLLALLPALNNLLNVLQKVKAGPAATS
jgi:hypothetical protein